MMSGLYILGDEMMNYYNNALAELKSYKRLNRMITLTLFISIAYICEQRKQIKELERKKGE